MNWETAYASRYDITTSTDGNTWSPAASVIISQAGAEVTSFTARAARYVRITAVTRATAWGVSFWDVNVYGPADSANSPPQAVASASPLTGAAPLAVSFNGSSSSDPDGDPLTYAWDLDGNGTFTDATTANPSWTYQSAGRYDAALRVSDGKGGTDTTTVTIRVGAPVPTIATPSPNLRWAVGDSIGFSGSAVDGSGNPVPASGLSWNLVLLHGACPECHEHVLATYSGVASGTFTAPDHDYPSELELRLTATDSSGLSGSTSIRLAPRTVKLTLATVPSGLQVGLNGTAATAPLTRTVIVGSANSVSAPTPQSSERHVDVRVLVGWGHGEPHRHGTGHRFDVDRHLPVELRTGRQGAQPAGVGLEQRRRATSRVRRSTACRRRAGPRASPTTSGGRSTSARSARSTRSW